MSHMISCFDEANFIRLDRPLTRKELFRLVHTAFTRIGNSEHTKPNLALWVMAKTKLY
jgi:hypothetical protein